MRDVDDSVNEEGGTRGFFPNEAANKNIVHNFNYDTAPAGMVLFYLLTGELILT